jgi:hypothetical protein
MATNPHTAAVFVIRADKSASTGYVSFEIVELCKNSLMKCGEQMDNAAVMIQENRAINTAHRGIKRRLALEVWRRRARKLAPI